MINQKKLAVLIDADNAPYKAIEGLLDEIALLGVSSVRKIYGDFTSDNLKGWKNILNSHAIVPVQQFSYTTGKNSSDTALIIDAMDLLYTKNFDGFCIVSSDSDFTRLALRIRQDGLSVYGFGEKKTPKAFVSSCDKFIYIENLRIDLKKEKKVLEKASTKKSVYLFIENAINDLSDAAGWAVLNRVKDNLATRNSDFDHRNYGAKSFLDLVKKCKDFEIREFDPFTQEPKISIRIKRR